MLGIGNTKTRYLAPPPREEKRGKDTQIPNLSNTKPNDLSEERKTRELVGFKGRSSHVSCGSEKTSGRDGPGETQTGERNPFSR